MQVRAISVGFYGGSRRREGEVFDVKDGDEAKWFEPTEPQESKAEAKAEAKARQKADAKAKADAEAKAKADADAKAKADAAADLA